MQGRDMARQQGQGAILGIAPIHSQAYRRVKRPTRDLAFQTEVPEGLRDHERKARSAGEQPIYPRF